MSNTFVGQLFFNSLTEPTGFSETYHFSQGSYTAAASALLAILPTRIALLCTDVQLVGFRLSQDGVRGDIYPIPSITIPTVGGWTTGTDKSAPLWTAILCKWTNTSYNRNSHYLHGVPTAQTTGQLFTPITAYGTLLTAYFNAVIANASYRQVRNVGGVSLVNILTIGSAQLASRRVGRSYNLFHAHGERR